MPDEQKPPRPVMPDVMTTEQAAEYLGISRRTIERLVAAGKIPVSRVGTLPRIRRVDLDEYLIRAREVPAPVRGQP